VVWPNPSIAKAAAAAVRFKRIERLIMAILLEVTVLERRKFGAGNLPAV
jgi:hypothetical protein